MLYSKKNRFLSKKQAAQARFTHKKTSAGFYTILPMFNIEYVNFISNPKPKHQALLHQHREE